MTTPRVVPYHDILGPQGSLGRVWGHCQFFPRFSPIFLLALTPRRFEWGASYYNQLLPPIGPLSWRKKKLKIPKKIFSAVSAQDFVGRGQYGPLWSLRIQIWPYHQLPPNPQWLETKDGMVTFSTPGVGLIGFVCPKMLTSKRSLGSKNFTFMTPLKYVVVSLNPIFLRSFQVNNGPHCHQISVKMKIEILKWYLGTFLVL